MKKQLLLQLSVLTIFFTSNAQIINNGLAGYYPFNGNANDGSGNGNHGTPLNGVVLTSDRFGNSNAAYHFDGNDDYISIPPSAFQNNNYSYCAWVKPMQLPASGGISFIISIGEQSTGTDQSITLNNDYWGMFNGWGCASYYSLSSNIVIINVTGLPNINEWYHIVMTRDSSELRMYLNGQFIAFTNALGTIPFYGSPTTAHIGGRCDNTATYFNGALDDIYIFNRALSANEVMALYYDCTVNCPANLISGKIYRDADNSCTFNAGDSPLKDWLVKIEPGPRYAVSDTNGNYEAWVDTGTYTVSEIIPNKLWNSTSCNAAQTVSFSSPGDSSLNNDFGNTGLLCPLLWVDISTSIFRNCPTHDFNYYVNYCNHGTADAVNAYIEIEFTPDFSIKGSSLPWTSVNGTTYRFDVGTLVPGQCGGFAIAYQLDCDNQMGQTLCVKAEIFPNTSCEPADAAWDKSSVSVDGECTGDSITRFFVTNTGNAGDGDMDGPVNYRIYVNDSLNQSGQLQLKGQETDTIDILACGNTIRLEVDQRPGHPGHSRPRATIEACGSSCGTVVYGFGTNAAEDDEDKFVEWDCHEVRNSFDPNEKLVKPSGATANKYISSRDEMEYQINFQNTGNDTAYIIVVKDTLPQYLDVSTIQMASASHAYTWTIKGSNVIEWTFKDINLVDSFTNEKESHGFVKFKVKQIVNNPDGTVISNGAGIYFDNNPPVLTEKVTVTVNDKFLLETGLRGVLGSGKETVIVYPNPFSKQAMVQITNPAILLNESGNYEFRMYDMLSREVYSSHISHSTFNISPDVTSGVYFYTIGDSHKQLARGKIVVQK